jgi:hypothetical protein
MGLVYVEVVAVWITFSRHHRFSFVITCCDGAKSRCCLRILLSFTSSPTASQFNRSSSMSLIASAFADLATKAQASIRSRSYSEPSDRASDASSFAESMSLRLQSFNQHTHSPPTGSSRPKLTLRSPLSSPTTLRANEHLAVLLPKNLWKVCKSTHPIYVSELHFFFQSSQMH